MKEDADLGQKADYTNPLAKLELQAHKDRDALATALYSSLKKQPPPKTPGAFLRQSCSQLVENQSLIHRLAPLARTLENSLIAWARKLTGNPEANWASLWDCVDWENISKDHPLFDQSWREWMAPMRLRLRLRFSQAPNILVVIGAGQREDQLYPPFLRDLDTVEIWAIDPTYKSGIPEKDPWKNWKSHQSMCRESDGRTLRFFSALLPTTTEEEQAWLKENPDKHYHLTEYLSAFKEMIENKKQTRGHVMLLEARSKHIMLPWIGQIYLFGKPRLEGRLWYFYQNRGAPPISIQGHLTQSLVQRIHSIGQDPAFKQAYWEKQARPLCQETLQRLNEKGGAQIQIYPPGFAGLQIPPTGI